MTPDSRARSRYAPIPEAALKVARSVRLQLSRLNAGGRMEPAYLIVGTQKGGTSSLQSYLGEHPSVFPPRLKEIDYFNRGYHRSYSWYRAQFPRRPSATPGDGEPITGEATPEYLFDPRCPGRIAKHLPDAKLIVLLRDPITRALSHYNHERARDAEPLSFREALEAEESRTAADAARALADPEFTSYALRHYTYAARGMYAEQLERWFSHFTRDQVLVLQSEILFEQPDPTYQRVLDFLGLHEHHLAEFPAYNSRKYSGLEPDDRRYLEDRFAEPNERLFELLGERFDWGVPAGTGA